MRIGSPLFLFLFFLLTWNVHGQSVVIQGQAQDAATGKAIPFPKVVWEETGKEYLGDMEGQFQLVLPDFNQHISVSAYQYLGASLKAESTSLTAAMYYAHPFTFQTITTGPAKGLVRRLWKSRSKLDPDKEEGYQYQSYNKIVITTQYVSALKVYLDNLVRIFTRPLQDDLSTDHHVFLMESAASRRYKSFYKQKETVVASRVSGINKPPALSLASGFEPLSVYEPFLRIGSKKYISPLAGRPNNRYIFFVTDSIRLDTQTIYVVKFNPRGYRNRELMQGFLYVGTRPFGVMAFQAWPAFDKESTFSVMQQCTALPSGRWFPSEIKTTYQSSKIGSVKIPITATSKTYIFNQTLLERTDSLRFNEVIFDFQSQNLVTSGSDFPAGLRQERLSQKDKNTYAYFQRMGSLKAIDRYLNFGQKLAAGRIPFGKVDLVFRRAITINDREGLRLGLGFQSTEVWSERHLAGGYFARGLKDKKWKFGLNYQFRPGKKDAFTLNWKKDLAEPGIFQFDFNKPQYSTEQLRSIRISRFDAIQTVELGWNHQWAPNFISRIAAEGGRRDYLYKYRFLPDLEAIGIDVAEVRLGLHWAPGEQFARFGHEKFSLGSRFPMFWFQYARGLGFVSGDAWDYSRLEAKMQWSRRILGWGEPGIQIAAGIQTGEIPYPLLFSGRASYRDFSLLSYNSFETMRYNEFLQDRYFSLFYSHKFARMQISTLPFRPYFTFLQNMGWSKLAHPERHEGVSNRDFRKGFFESGLFLNDIFVIPMSGLNLGIGAGVFLRYGPYALDGYLENVAFKFSANLGL